MKHFKWLGRTWVLLLLLVATVSLTAMFGLLQNRVGGPLLDAIYTGGAAVERIAQMSADQRAVHFWGTVLIDSAYPLAYGGLFAGITFRFGRGRDWLAWPAFATVSVDYPENAVQALALSDTANWLAAKSILTPLKMGLFAVAALIAIYLVAWAIGAKIADMREMP